MSTLIIAEAGVNHNGELAVAKRLVDVAAEAGADLVKFQTFSADRLVENAKTLIDSIVKAKPAASKGKYVRSFSVSSTMGPGVQVDLTAIEK